LRLQRPTRTKQLADEVGIVVMDPNEGERLVASLASVKSETNNVLYIDPGSADASTAAAEGLAVSVLNLDLTRPFTGAGAGRKALGYSWR